MCGGAAPTQRAAAAPRRGAVCRGGRRETKGVRPIHHSTPRGCGGGWGKETGAALRYFCRDNVAEVSAGLRPTLAGALGLLYSMWGCSTPNLPLSFPSYWRQGRARRSPANGEPVALRSPSLPRTNNGGRAGGRGWLGGIFFFFHFLPPAFFPLSIPSWKAKAIRNKGNNEGFAGCRVRGGLMGWGGGSAGLRFSFPAPGMRP